MTGFYVFMSILLLAVCLGNVISLRAMAQNATSENETFPMALQRVPTKNMTDSTSENGNETFPMALQRVPTKNMTDSTSENGNETFPMALQRVPTKSP